MAYQNAFSVAKEGAKFQLAVEELFCGLLKNVAKVNLQVQNSNKKRGVISNKLNSLLGITKNTRASSQVYLSTRYIPIKQQFTKKGNTGQILLRMHTWRHQNTSCATIQQMSVSGQRWQRTTDVSITVASNEAVNFFRSFD